MSYLVLAIKQSSTTSCKFAQCFSTAGRPIVSDLSTVLAASFAWAVFLELLEGDNAANKEWLVVDDFINYTGW